MAATPLSKVVQHLRRIAFLQEAAKLKDEQLLHSFLVDHEEAAFEALVRRHGPMVLGVCRRVLRNRQDAEDAFQATFLVLLRKAASIGKRALLANWLYGVAHRTAMHARRASARRRAKEERVQDMNPREVIQNEPFVDMLPQLDQELSRLPEKYRVPIVLCDLESKSRREAAQLLGLPEHTLSTRLARARVMLAKKLARHGTTLSCGAVLMAMSQRGASALVPLPLVASTVKAASILASGKAITAGIISAQVLSLIEGVVKTMLLNKLKIALAMMLVVTVMSTGVAAIATTALRGSQTETKHARGQLAEPPQKDKQPPKTNKGKTFSTLAEIDAKKQTVKVFIELPSKDKAIAQPDVFPNPTFGSPVILKVDPATKVIIDGKDAKFADLNPSFSIKAFVDYEIQLLAGMNSEGNAIRIETFMRRQTGVLNEIAPDETTIFTKTEEGDFEGHKTITETGYDVAKDVEVEIDGQPGRFSDLKPKMWVSLQLSAVKELVVGIRAFGPKVAGVVNGINADENTMNIKANINGIQWNAEAIAVKKGAKVVIEGKEGKLTDLRVGMAVVLQMSAQPDQTAVVSIAAGKTQPK